MSIRILPARLASPAARSASTDASPLVALITISPCAAVSLREPTFTPAPAAHAATFSGLRALTITSCPRSASFAASVCPTMPEPRIPIFMCVSPFYVKSLNLHRSSHNSAARLLLDRQIEGQPE